MSRSRRKPWVKDGYGSKWKRRAKSYSNRKIRRKLKDPEYEIPDGMAYKNGPGLDRWDICDYRWQIDKPVQGGRYCGFGYWETEEEMEETYRKVTTK